MGLVEGMEDFEGWYEREHGRVLGACVALSGDVEAAVDATDEAFVRAYERWHRVRGMTAPGAWVQTVAINCLRRQWRRRPSLPPGGGPVKMTLPDPDLWAAVRALPRRQREAVVLRYIGDLPEADIASAMRVTRGTVASTLADARRSLRAALCERADLEEEVSHG